MDWFLYDNGLRHERVNVYVDRICLYINDLQMILNKSVIRNLAQYNQGFESRWM